MQKMEIQNLDKNSILQAVTQIKDKGQIPEVESRFQNVDIKAYHRILKHYSTRDKTTVISTDYIINSVRHSIIQNSDTSYTLKTIQKDRNIHTIDFKEYDLRFSVSAESPSPSQDINDIKQYATQASLTRHKDRTSILDQGGLVRIDLTKVTSLSQSQSLSNRGDRGDRRESKSTYEVEVEIVGEVSEASIDALIATTINILTLVQNSNNIYTITQRNQVMEAYNTILTSNPGTSKDDRLIFGVLAQARDLKRADCVAQGLGGAGKFQYTLTNKAKGMRKILVFHQTGVWLIYPPLEFDFIMPIDGFIEQTHRDFILRYVNSFFDGESIPLDVRLNFHDIPYLYIPFDCIAIQGNIAIQQTPLSQRQEYVKSVMQPLSKPNSTIKIVYKLFLDINLKNAFTLLDELDQEDKSYETDGYVVTPQNSQYVISKYNTPLSKRTLVDDPEICKLKPWEELTIDFKYDFDNSSRVLSVRKVDKGTTVKFEGTEYNPFDQETQVDWEHKMFTDLPSGTIIEMGPYNDNIDGEDIIRMKPVLIRDDKPLPNGEDMAKMVWNDINKPLRIETLKGQTFDLMFQYHNVEKRQLLHAIPRGADVIEIGAGRGGDISKLLNAGRILAIEPSFNNAEEYRRRAALSFNGKSPMSDRIALLEVKAEDTETIIPAAIKWFGWRGRTDKPLYIISMLSLSFFYGPNESYKKLYDTIKTAAILATNAGAPLVKFLFMTISQKQFRKAFAQKIGDIDLNTSTTMIDLSLGSTQINLTPPNTVFINIPDTIVDNQIEYPVPIDHLRQNLGLSDFSGYVCDKEKFLSPNELILTSVYVAGSGNIAIPQSNISATAFADVEVQNITQDLEDIRTRLPEPNPIDPSIPTPDVELPENKQSNLLLLFKNGNIDYVAIINRDPKNSIWEACLNATKLTNYGNAQQLRDGYLRWLQTPTQYSNNDVIAAYGGHDPSIGGIVPINSNYYVSDKYHILLQPRGGFNYISQIINSDVQVSHQLLSPLSNFIGFNIGIYIVRGDELVLIADFKPNVQGAKTISILYYSNSEISYDHFIYYAIGSKYHNSQTINTIK